MDRGAELGLADRENLRIFQPGERARKRHVGVKNRAGVGQQPMHRRVDAIAGLLDDPLAREQGAVVADLHEAARRHLGPVEPKRDLVVAVVPAGHPHRQVIEDSLVEAVHHGKAVGRGEIDPRLPLRQTDIDAVLDRFLKHDIFPRVQFQFSSAARLTAP